MNHLFMNVLLSGLILTGSSNAAPAPAPGPQQNLVLPQQIQATPPVGSQQATAPATPTIPPTGSTPGVGSASTTGTEIPPTASAPRTAPAASPPTGSAPRIAPAASPPTGSAPRIAPAASPPTGSAPRIAPAASPPASNAAGLTLTPRVAPASAPPTQVPSGSVSSSSTPGRPSASPSLAPAAGATPPSTSTPSRASVVSPAQSPASQSSGSTSAGASTSNTPGTTSALAPAPAVSPSSSGFYNVTVQASNATGALNQQQSTQLQSQIQQYLSSNGISTGVRIASQSVGSSTASAGRRLQQTTINLNINLVLGPLSPSDAANCRQLLNNLNLNLGGVVVIVVVIFVPVPVAVAVPPTINNPPNVPTLPPSANITIPQAPSPPGTGSNIASQNVAGGGSVTSVGIVNNVNSGNIVNTNSGNSNITNINNVNSGNTNTIINNVVNNVQNPTTPGSQTPATPSPTTPGSSTPGATPAPASTTPSTPGGASSVTASTTATPPTYITQAAPTGSSPPPIPSPPPSPPPSCGSQPQCRIFSRDMLCCQNEGILTPFQGAQVEILCTHPVRFAITCLATSGPTNISAASVYNNDYGYNYNFRTNINWLGQVSGYLGKVSVDVQPARFAADRPECSLDLQTPCDYNGNLVSTMPAVQPLSFNVIDFTSFYQNYVGYPPTNAIGQFSYSWMNDTYPGGCLEQPTLTVPGSFFLGSWPTQPGFAYPCNASATYSALQQQCPSQTTQFGSGVQGIAP